MAKKSIISKEERRELYSDIKHLLGFPMRKIELTDKMLNTYLKIAMQDYSSYVNEWLISQQWVSLRGVEVDKTDFLLAFSTQSNDFMKQFTYAYSKQVGLGANAPAGDKWHLKKDFIVVSGDTQVYSIPAEREINEVLWSTPPNVNAGNIDPFGGANWGTTNLGWAYMGTPAQYVQPTYSLLLSAQDRDLKKRIIQSELTYRVTGGPNGTKLLYLYPVPGGKYEIAGAWGKHFHGTKVWYFYYDTTDGERDKCKEENNDIIKLPSDVPVDFLTWDRLNTMARTHVRKLFLATTKTVLGEVRGKFSGKVGSADVELVMDYRHMLEEGERLMSETKEDIFKTLEKLSLVQMTEDRARIAENVNRERSFQPIMFPIITK